MTPVRGESGRKWDAIYRQRNRDAPPPPPWVLHAHRQLLPDTGRALDIACGTGGGALFLAQRGLRTTACDISGEAIKRLRHLAGSRGLEIRMLVCDAAAALGRPRRYDVITVSRYLDRGLMPLIARACKDRGLVYYQTFAGAAGPKAHPRNPLYRLGRNELLHFFLAQDFEILSYREAPDGDEAMRDQACLVARRRGQRAANSPANRGRPGAEKPADRRPPRSKQSGSRNCI